MQSDRRVENHIDRSPEPPNSRSEAGGQARTRPPSSTIVAIAIAATATVGIIVTLVTASRLPDLRLVAVGFDVVTVAAGENFEVTDQVTSVGAIPSSPTITGLCLSPTPVRGSDCLPLKGSRAIPSLSPGKGSTEQTMVTVPPGTLAGRYYVIECVGNAGRNTESNLRNNCSASTSVLTVTNP